MTERIPATPGVVPSGAAGPSPAELRTTPTRIHVDRAAGTLELAWADGHATRYAAVELRWLCPCAFCRGEAGLPGWLDTSPTLTPTQTQLTDMHMVGSYAVAPTWGDGHHTGYYPFVLLRDRCGCAECRARRESRLPSLDSETVEEPT